jgi:uncharacterized protein YodC (DUF2158 family)
MKFKIGDVVMLNSGGPQMTVSAVTGDKVTAVWPDEQGYGKLEAPAVCFRPASTQQEN